MKQWRSHAAATAGPRHRLWLAVVAGTAATAVAATSTFAAMALKTNGYYTNVGHAKGVVFGVEKKGKKFAIYLFTLGCGANAISARVDEGNRLVPISSSDTFSYNGTATAWHRGNRGSSVTLKYSGRFVSATEATGHVTPGGSKVPGCTGQSFTVKFAKRSK
jgi:hypothetical protein